MVVGLPKILPPNGVSRGCVLVKNHHAPFKFGTTQHKQIELVHSDISFIKKHSLGGVGFSLKRGLTNGILLRNDCICGNNTDS